MDRDNLLAYRLVSDILQMSDVSEEACSVIEYWKARGWRDEDGFGLVEPTPAERQAALAKLRITDQ